VRALSNKQTDNGNTGVEPSNPAPAFTSARDAGMTNHATGDSVPAAGAELAGLERQPGAGGKELVQGARGQSPLEAREASLGLRSEAEQPPSLDQIENNRDNDNHDLGLNQLGRKRYCGVWTVTGYTSDRQRIRFHRVNCKTWGCPFCGPRKAKRYKWAIRHVAEKHQLNKLLTLTLDPQKIEGEPVAYLRSVFNKFRTYLKRRYGVSPKYIAVLEFQKNGNPHLHLLIDRFIPQQWVSEAWSALGGGRIVDIRYVDLHRISRYLSKYLTKELLLSAPKGARRVTTSRSIHLIEKKEPETPWVLLRTPISELHRRLFLIAIDVQDDEEGILEGFSIFSNEQ
jgi:hypothetical protein